MCIRKREKKEHSCYLQFPETVLGLYYVTTSALVGPITIPQHFQNKTTADVFTTCLIDRHIHRECIDRHLTHFLSYVAGFFLIPP